MTKHRLLRCLPYLLAASMMTTNATAAAEPAATKMVSERPRVGLVLGGGGARGAAHIGVLRELERLRVPIDAIAGTSMGALVGGLYASGMTPAELEKLASSIDWIDELSDTPRRSDLNFRRKEDDREFPVNVEIGLRDGAVAMPMGLVQGHRLDLLLHELTSNVSHITDFDHLPIPFRAVASDVENAEAYVIGHGDLAMAMRASMSVPGILAPATIADRLLVDGGIVANLPIDVIRSMDVDVIIAVDVEFPLYPPEDLDSAIRVSEQVLTMLIRRETRRQIDTLGDADILLRPDLGTFSSTDFGAILDTIEPGADAAVAATDRLRELGVNATAYADYEARRQSQAWPDERLAFVRIVHDGTLSDETLEARVYVDAGDRINYQRMQADADRLFGLNLYEHVSFRIVEEDGRKGVEYHATTKSWGTNDLLFGLSIEEGFEGSTAFNLNARITRVGLNDRGAEWRTDLQLGTEPAVFSEFYQPLAPGAPWFVAPRIELRQSNLGVFVSNDEFARLRVSEAEAGLDIGYAIGYSGELRLGAYRGVGKTRVNIGDPGLPKTDFDSGGLLAELRFDTFDHAHFPRRGLQASLRWNSSRRSFAADNEFDTFAGDITSTWSRGRNTYQVGLGYATTTDGAPALQDLFALGGFQRLSGLQRDSLTGPHAALARLVYYRSVRESAGVFDTPMYLGVSVEAGNVWQSRSDIGFDSALVNGSVFAGLDTLVGPVFLAAGFGEGGERNLFLLIGARPR